MSGLGASFLLCHGPLYGRSLSLRGALQLVGLHPTEASKAGAAHYGHYGITGT